MTSQPAQDQVQACLERAVAALGGQPRAGQQAMAAAVQQAFDQGEHLLVQAGTGTGKSLAYLVPALFHAVNTDQRVVIATATLALQRQIMVKDLPLAVEAVAPALPRPPKVALLKGRANYLCRHKLTGGYPDEDALFPADLGDGLPAPDVASSGFGRAGDSLSAQVKRLHVWAAGTETGDRDEVTPGVTPRAWRQVSVSARECLGANCPLVGDCFAEAAKALANLADMVVTNHALLAINATGNPVLPEFTGLVIDEAHQLAASITSAQTGELSASMVRTATRALERLKADQPKIAALEQATLALDKVLDGVPDGRFGRAGYGEELRTALEAARAAARGGLSAAEALKDQPKLDAARKQAGAELELIADMAQRLLKADPSLAVPGSGPPAEVVWCSRPQRGGDGLPGEPALYVAPLDVATLARDKVLGEATAVLTSATLKVGGSLAATASAVGLGPQADGEWRGLDVGSPFDYSKQAILYVAADLPAPGRDGVPQAEQHARLADLIRAGGGGTLGLFSSRRAAEAAAEALRETLDLPIYCQGEAALPSLIDQFVADPAASLFGTLSLWQGVDAPGLTCRLVAIDRLPFPRPDDPVMSARKEAADQTGGNGFMQVTAAQAGLLLAQGAGRLIRRAEDRGVVAVLDPRLATARYGRYLLAGLPPMWLTTDTAQAIRSLQNLAPSN
ncbi:MAG: ATP-dependent DNA helicase [Bifidobacteriaceae bacterium]|nr:ATP-dependent DNA helicase [Bifidobacteriaceae bacterium]